MIYKFKLWLSLSNFSFGKYSNSQKSWKNNIIDTQSSFIRFANFQLFATLAFFLCSYLLPPYTYTYTGTHTCVCIYTYTFNSPFPNYLKRSFSHHGNLPLNASLKNKDMFLYNTAPLLCLETLTVLPYYEVIASLYSYFRICPEI